MSKIIYVFCFVVLLLVQNNFSQSTNNGDELLYSQTGFPKNYVSLPSYVDNNGISSQVADDFTSPTDWTISRIILMGPDIDNSIDGFNIYIYTDDNGVLGSLIYSAESQPYTYTHYITYIVDKVTITPQKSISLHAGHYWISVQGKTVFYWNQITDSFGEKALVRSITSGWAPIGFYDSYSDMYFELYGSILTSVESNIAQPIKFALSQNYPNPFNPTTTIKYSIPASLNPSKGGTLVTLKVYDVLGNEVSTLVNEEKPAGSYEVNFNASNLSSGIYFYGLKAGKFNETKKLILMK